MNKKYLTLTIISNMTSNYGESLGNVSSVQKFYRNNHVYSMRSKESLKNAIMVQSGMYDDLETAVDKATQKLVREDLNVATCRALEAGYMNTFRGDKKKDATYVRKSSFYLTDAVACEKFSNETRFHNDLYLASNYAKSHGLNIQKDAEASGLMIYQYEFDKNLKVYSFTIDLSMVGVDENFSSEADTEEKIDRVCSILKAIQNLSLVVKGNLDNAEPIFIVGGLTTRSTHVFENLVKVKSNKLVLSDELINKTKDGYSVGLLKMCTFDNEDEIINLLNPISVNEFFDKIEKDVHDYYEKGVNED